MIVVDCIQGSEEWAEARRGVATASRFGDLLTAKKLQFSKAGARTYAYELLAERLVQPHYWISDDYQSRSMRNGLYREDEARNYLAFQLGLECKQVGFVMTDDKRWGASPDSLIGEDRGLELKCPLHKTQIKYLLNPQMLVDEYKAQAHGGMIVTKRNRWILMSYAVGLPPVIHEFTVDEYTVKLTEALEEFGKFYNELAAQLDALGDAAPRQTQESYW
jgi:hypothetical protein